MNINRHNYEDFFLLYVDRELCAADRKSVDVFVQQNPDLKIELDLLQQTVVSADDIVLDKKDWLYMEEDISVLQEHLLLYADDELSGADKKNIEHLIATDNTAQTAWAVLQQTKLQPDMDIVFADKQSLYRKEPAGVVPFKWWRVAAAAVLLGFGIWAAVSVYKNYNAEKAGTPELANSKKTNPEQKQPGAVVNNESIKEEQHKQESSADNISVVTTPENNSRKDETVKPAGDKMNNQAVLSSKKNATVKNSPAKKEDNNLPRPSQNFNNNNSNETIVQNVQPVNSNNNKVYSDNETVATLTPKENKTIVATANNQTNTNITALQVVNTNKATDEDNNNRYLNVDDDKQKRSALGGFLRKAKRVLERNTNVKTGDGIKIAGFEIALK